MPQVINGQTVYASGEALPAVGTPAYNASQNTTGAPAATNSPANPTASQGTGTSITSDPSGMDSDSFTGLLGSIGQKLKYNNDLASNRQLILKNLYDSPLTPDELAKLSPDMQNIVKSGDKDAQELQVRVLNDQLQGRANTLAGTISALSTGYQNSVTNTKNAMTEILAYAQSTGKPIADVVKALAPIYGVGVTNQMMQTLNQLGAAQKPLAGTPVAQNDGVYGPATSTVATTLGVSPTLPLSDVISQSGMDPVVDAIIKNEGSSPQGVLNNPGNIKYTGQPGQVDSGVKASDGGTFASYDTPENGRQAIEYIVQQAADSKSSAYGANPTLGDFVDKYTNTAPDRSINANPPDPETGNQPSTDLGGYTPNLVYQDALDYLFTGKTIQSFVGGLSNSGNSAAAKQAIGNKAAAIATAMGGSFPSYQALYKSDASAAKQNIERVARVESIANSMTLNMPRLEDLATKLQQQGVNITEADVQAGSAAALRKFGSTDAASYIELIQTIRSDYASTQAALAGSRGGSFFSDAANAAIPIGLTPDQYDAIKNTILLSSKNANQAINQEVDGLIGESGGTGQNSTPSGSSDDSDYAAYLKSIGQ